MEFLPHNGGALLDGFLDLRILAFAPFHRVDLAIIPGPGGCTPHTTELGGFLGKCEEYQDYGGYRGKPDRCPRWQIRVNQ